MTCLAWVVLVFPHCYFHLLGKAGFVYTAIWVYIRMFLQAPGFLAGQGNVRLRDGSGNPFWRPPPKRLERTARPDGRRESPNNLNPFLKERRWVCQDFRPGLFFQVFLKSGFCVAWKCNKIYHWPFLLQKADAWRIFLRTLHGWPIPC